MEKKRYPFVRGDVFDGLRPYRLSKPIKVKTTDFSYLFSEKHSKGVSVDYHHGMRVRLGTIFEAISKGVYGGEYKPTQEISGENGNYLSSEPDLFDIEKGLCREIKSFRNGGQLKFLDDQMEKYVQIQFPDMQTQMDLPGFLKEPKIRFELFRHKVKNLTKNHKDSEIERLVKEISRNIGFMISVPFSVAYAAYAHLNEGGGITYRYEGERESWYTSIKSSGLNLLLAHPGDALKDLGLDPDDFSVHRRRFPSNVVLNGNKISPFPVLVIKETNPEISLEKVRKQVEERRKLMEEMHEGYSLNFGKVERPRKESGVMVYKGDPFELRDPEELEIPKSGSKLEDEIPF